MMQLCPSIFRTKPCIPELDFSGTVVSLGPSVPASRGLGKGVEVFGSVLVPAHLKGAGSLSEYVALEADGVVPMPKAATEGSEGLGKEERAEKAAGLGVNGCTALMQMMEAEKRGLKEGMRVLVNGASGGIGTMVLQLARKAVGPSGQVIAICSGKNAELARKLGADEVSTIVLRLLVSFLHVNSCPLIPIHPTDT
jgi:NADPH:quinone reductase-like Zn-dependent oxidoreductase